MWIVTCGFVSFDDVGFVKDPSFDRSVLSIQTYKYGFVFFLSWRYGMMIYTQPRQLDSNPLDCCYNHPIYNMASTTLWCPFSVAMALP